MLHVGLFGFAMQGDFGLISRKFFAYCFGVGLQFSTELEFEQVLKVKLQFGLVQTSSKLLKNTLSIKINSE